MTKIATYTLLLARAIARWFQIGLDRLRRPLTVVEALQRRPYLRKMLAARRAAARPPASTSRIERNSNRFVKSERSRRISASSLRAEFAWLLKD